MYVQYPFQLVGYTIINTLLAKCHKLKFTFPDTKASTEDIPAEYDASKTSPVFFRQNYEKEEASNLENFDPSKSHPACVGYSDKGRPSS